MIKKLWRPKVFLLGLLTGLCVLAFTVSKPGSWLYVAGLYGASACTVCLGVLALGYTSKVSGVGAPDALEPPPPPATPEVAPAPDPAPKGQYWRVRWDILDDGGLVVTFDPQLAPNRGTLVTHPLIVRYSPSDAVEYARRIVAAHDRTSEPKEGA